MVAKNGTPQIKFNPAKDGMSKVLGPLEAQIMAVVWQMSHATASDVHQELLESRRQQTGNIAYTTVMTTMSRLYEKSILNRRKVGMSFVYTPALGRQEFINHVVKNVMDGLVSEYGDPVFDYFVDYIAHNDERRSKLRTALGTDTVLLAEAPAV
jgi:predicted transcriptional regulator